MRLLAHRRGPAPARRPGRRRGLPLQPVRDGRRRSGSTPASTSPTSRPSSRSTSPRRPTGRSCPTRPRPTAVAGARRRRHAGTSPTDRRGSSTYITALVAGPYHVVRDEYTGPHGTYPLGVFCRSSLAPYLDADDLFDVTKQGFAFFEDDFGHPYPFGKYDQLFVPEYNAGRDGERRLRDLHRGLRLPLPGHRRRLSSRRGQHDPARAGPHVVRQPRDDALVERPVAQRVVRRVGLAPRHGRGHALHRRVDRPSAHQRKTWAYRQDQLPSTHPIAADDPRPEDVEVNFDGITYAKGASVLKQLVAWVGRSRSSPGCAPTSPSTPGATPTSTTCSSSWRRPPGATCDLVRGSGCETAGRQHAAPGVEVDDRRHVRRRPSSRSRPAPPGYETLRPHRIARRPVRPCVDGALHAHRPLELDVDGRAHRGARSSSAGAQPDLLLVNDDDLTYAKIRLDERSLGHRHRAPRATSTRPMPRALVWAAAWDMTRDAEWSAGDYLAAGAVRACPPRPTSAWSRRSCCRSARRSSSTPHPSTATSTGAPGRGRALGDCSPQPRAATTSSPTPGPRSTWPGPPISSTSWPACSTARSPSTGWSSTPTCAGRCSGAWSPQGRAGRRRDRRRAGPRRHRHRGAAARPPSRCAIPTAAGQGSRPGRRRSPTSPLPNAHARGNHVRASASRPARAVPAVPRPLLRGHRRGLGHPQRRDGRDGGHGPLPGAAGRAGDGAS